MKCLLLYAILLFFLISPNNAFAKEYSCEFLDVQVTLLPNGNAQIVENWTFKYISGSFSTFTRTIPNKIGQEIIDIQASEKDVLYKKLPNLSKEVEGV